MAASELADREKEAPPETDEKTVRLLLHALRDLQFGQVTAIVQDGVVVQIERTEKRRLHRKTMREDLRTK